MTPYPGRLIAFEGGEGAGKSTQIKLLAARLQERGQPVTITREPGGTEAGAALRRLLLGDAGHGWTTMAETLLMVADRAQHVAEIICPALARGHTVLTDRFVYSTLAYQGAGRGVDPGFIRDLHARACADLWPDLTLILDIDPETGLGRSTRRLTREASDETRFEKLDLAFHRRVREAFLAFAVASQNVVVIAGSAPPAAVENAVAMAVGI